MCMYDGQSGAVSGVRHMWYHEGAITGGWLYVNMGLVHAAPPSRVSVPRCCALRRAFGISNSGALGPSGSASNSEGFFLYVLICICVRLSRHWDWAWALSHSAFHTYGHIWDPRVALLVPVSFSCSWPGFDFRVPALSTCLGFIRAW